MSDWSKHPPRTEGIYLFRGVRVTHNNQTLSLDEPVRVQHMQVGQRSNMGVALLGKARIYPVGSFRGMWRPLEPGVWLEGKLNGEVTQRNGHGGD